MTIRTKIRKNCEETFEEIYGRYVLAQTAKGVSEITLRNYKERLHNISKHFDIQKPLNEISKKDFDEMVIQMRKSGLSNNTIATYTRTIGAFLKWCQGEGLADIKITVVPEKESVKETYNDTELEKLLRKPSKEATFCEYRDWVIINFLLNSGCRAATVRNIKNRDVDLREKQVLFRHNKNGKIQITPLCSIMTGILLEYMNVRKGAPDDYLFCDQYGDMLSENALRLTIVAYNRRRGVEKTSIHMFRHTFARKYLIDCGGDAFTLQRLMGHSTLNMTKHYCRIYDADLTRNYDIHSPLTQISREKEKIKR